MAKKSHKRPARPKKGNAGCMSGLISMFDFRQGRYTQKLISDRKSGNGRYEGTVHSKNKFDALGSVEIKHEDVSDTGAKEVRRNNSTKVSVKALMAEEMSRAHTSKKILNSRVEQLKAELKFGDNLEKHHKRRQNQHHKVGSDRCVNDSEASWSSLPDPSESSSFDINLADLMAEFCQESHRCHDHIESYDDRNTCHGELDTHRQYVLQKTLRNIGEALLTGKSIDSEQITNYYGAVEPKDFMDVLETLDSNKDVFLKLLQDPNSLLSKHILDLQNAESHENLSGSRPEESAEYQISNKQSRHHFFRKKDKSDGTRPTNEGSSDALKKIVVLKPRPTIYENYSNIISPSSSPKFHYKLPHQEVPERVSTQFSLKEIKRRFRNVIGENKKERDLIARDGILHKIPYGVQNTDENNRNSSSTQQRSKLSSFLKGGENDANLKQHCIEKKVNKSTGDRPLNRETVYYAEAKKRLAEMLNSDCQKEVSSSRQNSRSLGRILSLPEYSSYSPKFSPGRDKEVELPGQMRSSQEQKIKRDESTFSEPSFQSIESSSNSDSNPDTVPQVTDSTLSVCEVQLRTEADLIQKGSPETEVCENLATSVEFSTDELGCSSEGCNIKEPFIKNNIEELPMISDLGTREEAHECTTEHHDRPSPVSVLEAFSADDIDSPERTVTDHAELTVELRHLCFEECEDSVIVLTSTVIEDNLKERKFKYVRSVLEASGLKFDKLPERWQLSDQLLDPFVFDEIEILYGQLIDDSKLLFDCINEVLVEIMDRYLSCTPWTSFIKPTIRPTPTGENFVQEVWREVDRNLQIVIPYTLDRVVRKDLEGRTWMNIRLENEAAVVEIAEVILEYIMEETILELWD